MSANYVSLSYILFLHQTTTIFCYKECVTGCLISYFYIKPQLRESIAPSALRCLISYFYIKPQLSSVSAKSNSVVLYPISTSNHNHLSIRPIIRSVVLYPISTSNHNLVSGKEYCHGVVLYPISTSNHNLYLLKHDARKLSYILFLHQTTTKPMYLSIFQIII